MEYVKISTVSVPLLNILTLHNLDGPTPAEVVQALTCSTAQDAFNLERLETLGDSYLKFIVSLYLHDEFPLHAEGRLTALKGKMIGNRSNFIAPAFTTPRSLQKILLDTEVSPSVLYDLTIPMAEQMSGHLSLPTLNEIEVKVADWAPAETQTGLEHFLGIQTIVDKTVADCVEALIGLYLRKMGLEGAITLLKWFGVLPNNVNISELLHCNSKEPLITEGNPDYHMPWACSIEERMGYKFHNRAYLLQAFTHASYTANGMTDCYERLEFLGDAILDFLLTSYIYETCGELTPGALTDLRSALVNNITFACLAVRHGLHTALLAYAPKVNNIIDRFVKFQEQRDHVINDELIWVILEEEECNMVEHVDVPKILGDLYESFIGAVYLDCNKNLSKVWEIIYRVMHKEIELFSKNVPKQPIRVIYETPGAKPVFLTPSIIEGTNTVMVPLRITVAGKEKLFHGFGSSKKQAKCAAAKQALKSLRSKK
ncbi:hypothetical protein KM043_018832 [Ampulex compressa]|nr:hypothetical protein KM043_018832 [Ampulex compressa]